MLRFAQKLALAAAVSVPAVSFAAGPDYSTVTAAVDFGSVVTGVLAIAALAAGVYVAVKGAKMVIGMIRGA